MEFCGGEMVCKVVHEEKQIVRVDKRREWKPLRTPSLRVHYSNPHFPCHHQHTLHFNDVIQSFCQRNRSAA
jgi:hypothetical protein